MSAPLFAVSLPHRTDVTVADVSMPTPPTSGINVAKYSKVAVITTITFGSGTYDLAIYGSTKGETAMYRLLYPGKIEGADDSLNIEVDVTHVEYLYVHVPAISGVIMNIGVVVGATP